MIEVDRDSFINFAVENSNKILAIIVDIEYYDNSVKGKYQSSLINFKAFNTEEEYIKHIEALESYYSVEFTLDLTKVTFQDKTETLLYLDVVDYISPILNRSVLNFVNYNEYDVDEYLSNMNDYCSYI